MFDNNSLSFQHSQGNFITNVPSHSYKRISEEKVLKVKENNPFGNIRLVNYSNTNTQSELKNFKQAYELMLEQTYPHILRQVNISSYKQNKEFNSVLTSFKMNFAAQANQLQDAFESGNNLLSFFEQFDNYIAKGHADFKNVNALKLAIEAFINTISEGNQVKSKLNRALKTLVEIKTKAGIMEIPEVLPIENISEIVMAFPVWFVDYLNMHNGSYISNFDIRMPEKTRQVIHLYNSQNFYSNDGHWLPFSAFQGADIMPLDVVAHLGSIKQLFDFVVIGTPYHDIASARWKSPLFWQRNIDPVLLGFIRGSNYFVVIRRWSASGIFPKITEMIADTVDHLEQSTKTLKNQSFERIVNPIIESYQKNNLFSYLKS